jgi:hypothetical protein
MRQPNSFFCQIDRFHLFIFKLDGLDAVEDWNRLSVCQHHEHIDQALKAMLQNAIKLQWLQDGNVVRARTR